MGDMKGWKYIFVAVFGICFLTNTSAQMTSAEQSDPKATKLLNKLKATYDGYKSMEVSFDLILELPGQPVETQTGNVVQAGDKFVAKLDAQQIYCNGEAVWLYLKDNNEVQINDYDELSSGDMISPKDMLRLYEEGEFVTGITGEEMIGSTKVTLIEFKPLDKDSEYSKLRLYLDTKKMEAKMIKVFSKDASRYTLKVHSLVPNKSYKNDFFTFDASAYPDIYVEDLRM